MMLGFGLLVLLLVGGLILALTGSGSRLLDSVQDSTNVRSKRRVTPRQILDERLARGEIEKDEYETIRARLDS